MAMFSTRPRRSVLYMPASNLRALDKARSLDCDGIVFDLEDAVAVEAKNSARDQLLGTLTQGGYGQRERIVRVNDLDSEWCKADVEAVVGCDIHAILFPKINSAAELRAAIDLVDTSGGQHLAVWAMLETPAAILNAESIAAESARLEVLVMGTADLAAELRVQETPERTGLQTALQLCVLAARAHGREILDGVFIEFKNLAAFSAVCKQGRQLGFDGKTLIHPTQIEQANSTFGASETDIVQAHALISAWNAAQQKGEGVAVYEGRLIENLHVRQAQRLLACYAETEP